MKVQRSSPSLIAHPGRQGGAKACVWLIILTVVFTVAACYPPPYRAVSRSAYEETGGGSPAPAPAQQLYFYPKAGQTNEQQSRDHYECYNWAINQTGFDPSQSTIPRDQRVRVVPMPPPGHDTAALAIAGAVLGALIGGPRHALGGAIIGGSAGVIAGAASDSARQESAQQMNEAYASQDRQRDAQLDAKALGFRRAMSACMEGRGYSVR